METNQKEKRHRTESVFQETLPFPTDSPLSVRRQLQPPRQKTNPQQAFEKTKKIQRLIRNLAKAKQTEGESEHFNQIKDELKDLVSQNVFTMKQEISEHTRDVRSMVSSPDFKTVVSSDYNCKIVVWERNDDEPGQPFEKIQELIKHKLKVLCLDMSKDSRVLVSGSGDDHLIIWTRKNPGYLFKAFQILKHKNRICSTALSNSKTTLVTGVDITCLISVYSREKESDRFKLVHTIKHHTGRVTNLILTDDSKTLVSSGKEGTLAAWSREETTGKYTLKQNLEKVHSKIVFSLLISRDQKIVCSACFDGNIYFWELRSREEAAAQNSQMLTRKHTIDLNGGVTLGVTLTPDFRTLICVTVKGILVYYRDRPESFRFSYKQRLVGYKGYPQFAVVHPEGNTFMSSTSSGQLIIWSRPKKSTQSKESLISQTLKDSSQAIRVLSVSQDSLTLLSLPIEGVPVAYARKSTQEKFRVLQRFDDHPIHPFPSGCLSKNSKVIVYGGPINQILIFRRKKRGKEFKLSQVIPSKDGNIYAVDMTMKAELVAVGVSGKVVALYKYNQATDKYKAKRKLKAHSSHVISVKFSQDGLLLVSGSVDYNFMLWKREDTSKTNFKLFRGFSYHKAPVVSIDFSADTQMLVTSSESGRSCVWRRSHLNLNFEPAQKFRFALTPGSEIGSVSLSNDGCTLITAYNNQSVDICKKDGQLFRQSKNLKCDAEVTFATQTDSDYFIASKTGDIEIIPKKNENLFSLFLNDYDYSALLYEALRERSFKNSMSYLCHYLPRIASKDEVQDDHELMRMNSLVNPIYWFSSFGYPDLLEDILKDYEYEDWVYEGNEEFDPFLVALEGDNLEVLDVWADYFETNPKKLFIKNRDLLYKMMRSSNARIQAIGVQRMMATPEVHPGVDLIHKYSIDDDKGYESFVSEDWRMSLEIKKALKDQEDTSNPTQKVEIKSTSIVIPVNLAENIPLIMSVQNMTSDNKLEIRPLILAIYAENIIYFLLYSLINAIGGVLFFMIVVFRYHENWVLALFYLTFILMILYEVADMLSTEFNYLRSIYNWIDMVLYPAGIGLVVYVTNFNYNFLSNQAKNTMVVLLLYMNLTRVVSVLRVFDSTRYLILMILRVYTDMTPFLIVLFLYTIGTGAILMIVNITNEMGEFNLLQLKISSDTIYNWGYGNWENTGSLNGISFAFYIYTGVFIGLVMFNLLIAIVSGTYDEFTEERKLVDMNEVLNMLSSMASFLRYFSPRVLGIWPAGSVKGVFYYFVVPEQSNINLRYVIKRLEDVSSDQGRIEKDFNGKFDSLGGQLKEINQKLDKIMGDKEKVGNEMTGKEKSEIKGDEHFD